MKEALKAAIKAMENSNSISYEMMHAIADCKEALAQPEQGPVKYEFQSTHDGKWYAFHDDKHYADTLADGRWPIRALYTIPSKEQQSCDKRPWAGLTDEDKNKIIRMTERDDRGDVMALVEAKLKEKNT